MPDRQKESLQSKLKFEVHITNNELSTTNTIFLRWEMKIQILLLSTFLPCQFFAFVEEDFLHRQHIGD